MSKIDTLEELEKIVRMRKEEPYSVIAKALELGLKELWKETIIDDFLKKKITRKDAIKLVGLDLVKRAEKERKIVMEDVRWGLSA
jgi:hypothetical protein